MSHIRTQDGTVILRKDGHVAWGAEVEITNPQPSSQTADTAGEPTQPHSPAAPSQEIAA